MFQYYLTFLPICIASQEFLSNLTLNQSMVKSHKWLLSKEVQYDVTPFKPMWWHTIFNIGGCRVRPHSVWLLYLLLLSEYQTHLMSSCLYSDSIKCSLHRQCCGVKPGFRLPGAVTKTSTERCHSFPRDNSAQFMGNTSMSPPLTVVLSRKEKF